jgi:uncharacterized membrane protein YjjP (DUF1212 family)
MKFETEHEELFTILNNCSIICDALIPVSRAAGTGNVTETLERLARAYELILQANKSTYSIIDQIRTRHDTQDNY